MSTADDDIPSRRGAFFGRRKSHRLSPRRSELFDTLLPKLAIDVSATAPDDLSALFVQEVDAVRLEIGFGGGEHLIAEARRLPSTGFIGIEPFVNGMAKALSRIAADRLANIRLYHGDATDLLAWIPDATISCVDLLYPDPWPKRRHWKRRFVQDTSLKEIARVLQDKGEFRFATDWADYAAWTLVRVMRSPELEWTATKADDWRLPWRDFSQTRYGAKAAHAGRRSCYLVFRRREKDSGSG
jgi:tRNA (guanine-N7-)-methyltransferase